ncbi:hypothetical protein KCU98_g6587, partial [Aureobasidium melanogenum]
MENPNSIMSKVVTGTGYNPKDCFIAVMGVTGSGKSTFISRVTGGGAKIGHDLISCTSEIESFEFQYNGATVHLIDTPGFDDTNRTDSDVLRDIVFWLNAAYKKNVRLSGIVYLHPIDHNRMTGSAYKNLRMFHKLCGDESLQTVVLGTTMWANVDEGLGENRFQKLQNTPEFWGNMMAKGSRVFRHDDSRTSAMKLIGYILDQGKTTVLQIQRQMIDEGKSLNETSAGEELERELLQQRELFERRLREAQEELNEAIQEGNRKAAEEAAEQQERFQKKLTEAMQGSQELKVSMEKLLEQKDAEYKKAMAELQLQKQQSQQESQLAAAKMAELERKMRVREEEADEQRRRYQRDFDEISSRYSKDWAESQERFHDWMAKQSADTPPPPPPLKESADTPPPIKESVATPPSFKESFEQSADDIVIALMGVTGSGKSTFIKRVTGREDIQIGHELTSSTLECKAYRFQNAGLTFALVDTPGFNDTFLDDAAILAALANFMESTYRADVKLTAIIYLHPIINDRLEGSALDNLSMFQKLCGPNFYPNIVLATNFWSLVEETTGRRRERQLEENGDWWGRMKDHGSLIVRLPDDREECIALLMKLSGNEKLALQIQEELVDQQQPISKTRAGSIAKNSRALEELREEMNQQLATLATDREAALQKQRSEMERLQAEQRKAWEDKMQKYQEELAAAKKEQEASLREAEERLKKVVEEQEQINRETEWEKERVKEELARLKIKDAQESRQRELSQRKLNRDLAWERITTKTKNQIKLFEEAKAARTVKCKVSTAWEQTLLGRYCDECLYPCSAQVSYSQFSCDSTAFSAVLQRGAQSYLLTKSAGCVSCDGFDLCSNCFDAGYRCFDTEHQGMARRSLVGTDRGQCRRALSPLNAKSRITCDRCAKLFELGSILFRM